MDTGNTVFEPFNSGSKEDEGDLVSDISSSNQLFHNFKFSFGPDCKIVRSKEKGTVQIF